MKYLLVGMMGATCINIASLYLAVGIVLYLNADPKWSSSIGWIVGYIVSMIASEIYERVKS